MLDLKLIVRLRSINYKINLIIVKIEDDVNTEGKVSTTLGIISKYSKYRSRWITTRLRLKLELVSG